MRTWEAFQTRRPIGRIRRKLAALLVEALPGLIIYPEDLQQNNPAFSRAEVDSCTWDAWGTIYEDGGARRVHFYSWSPMGDCVKVGRVSVRATDPFDYDVDPYEPPIKGAVSSDE